MAMFPPKVALSIESAFNRFRGELEFYRLFLGEIVKPGASITQEDMEERVVFEALAVKVHASWEVFIRDIMIDCLSCDTAQHAKSMGATLPSPLPRDVCELMLTGTGILSMGDASKVRDTARQRLAPQYNPFKEISDSDVTSINEFQRIRNHIAHQSRHSMRGLEKVYRAYEIDFSVSPGDFLATFVTIHGTDERIARLGSYINSFSNASEEMYRYLFPGRKPSSV